MADARLDTQSPRVLGILSLGVVSFMLAPILVRFADDAPGMAVAAWRNVLAVLMLTPIALPAIRENVRRLQRRDALLIVCAGVFLGLHFILWIESLYHTTVASASVLVTTSPVFLAVFGYLLLGEQLSPQTLIGGGVAVAGATLIGVGDAGAIALGGTAMWGNALALSASLLVSVYLLIGRVVRQKVSWLAYVFPLYTVSAATTVAAAWAAGVPLFGYDTAFYGLCAAMALGPQIAGHGAFNYAVQYLPAAIVGMLALLEPVGASILAYALFAEVPPILAVVGMLVVLAGVTLVVWSRRSTAEPEAVSSDETGPGSGSA